ncbi:putative exported protein [Lysobacter antibioticus]|uniref:RHS repeat domain-containing protein n=1 Tax=Lysobacter antibioticus TaxID=84531 RepID=UPI00071F62FD|nr:RHS repeat-associated core domain-containing protein [Lysobacter antibioticus]ALN65466.1 putative exported protein [Lysobacter antibioticus]
MKWISNLVAAALLSFASLGAQAETVVEYIHTDALGSPVAVTDVNQNVVERSEYEPYGRLLNRPVSDGPGYTGHVSDAATGLAYMQQRYYDSEVGRFLSVDPVAANSKTGGNFNRYWYANNNPYRFIDPDGRYVCSGSKSHCTSLEKALERIASAASNPRLTSSERSVMARIAGFYGKPGEDNKVSVSFGALKGPGGTAAFRADGGAHITLDIMQATKKTENDTLNVLGRAAAHEGEHGANDRARGRPVATRAERKQEEVAGYSAQAYFQKSANFSESSSDGWIFWKGMISKENIERQAEGSVNTSCVSSREGSCK